VDSRGRTIFVADAHRSDGKRFVVRADEKPTAFVELELAILSGERQGRSPGRERTGTWQLQPPPQRCQSGCFFSLADVLKATPRTPSNAACLAAANVPECQQALPRFAPRLMAESARRRGRAGRQVCHWTRSAIGEIGKSLEGSAL